MQSADSGGGRASSTTVTEVYGVGSILAALLIGHTGDIGRFASKKHYASYNATAPTRHPAAHESATGSTRAATANSTTHSHGRGHPDKPRHSRTVYYQRKLAEGKSNKKRYAR